MTEALVNPGVLSWARRRRGLDTEELATKLNVKPEAVSAWEAGEKRSTFRQAQRFAQAVYIPFGYLYLSEPPVEEMPIADFRTIPGQPPRDPSPDFLDLLSDVLGKQQWFREYRLSEGVKVSSMVILRQAYDHDSLSTDEYRAGYRRLVEEASPREPLGESGENCHYTLTARNGAAFTGAVISGAADGTLLSSEAADLLGRR